MNSILNLNLKLGRAYSAHQANDVLRFGSFTLKSGRTSPYFFNAGNFKTGGALASASRRPPPAVRRSGRRSLSASLSPARCAWSPSAARPAQASVGRFYAQAVVASGIDFDVLFGTPR